MINENKQSLEKENDEYQFRRMNELLKPKGETLK